MRFLTLITSLVVSTAAVVADFNYTIPMAGFLLNDGSYYYAYTTVQNLSPRDATVRLDAVFPFDASRPCRSFEPFTVPAQDQVTIGPMTCMSSVSALSLVSNEQLSVRTELDTRKTRVAGWDKQIINAPTDWIAAGVTALSEAVIRFDGPRRANLLLINPSDQILTVNVDITRPELGLSDSRSFDVSPRSSRFVTLEEILDPAPPPFIYSKTGRHLLRITGNGPWQGGVSSVYNGPSMYVPATPLVP